MSSIEGKSHCAEKKPPSLQYDSDSAIAMSLVGVSEACLKIFEFHPIYLYFRTSFRSVKSSFEKNVYACSSRDAPVQSA